MTKDELVARLRDIEWDDFEVKAAKSDLPKNIWETVSAFSNCSGDWIVLGVKQSGRLFEIVGVDDIEKLEQDFFGTLRSKKFNVPLFARSIATRLTARMSSPSIFRHQRSNLFISDHSKTPLSVWVAVTNVPLSRK